MMKDHDPRYFDLKFQSSIFEGLEFIMVQKYKKKTKKSFFLETLFWCHRISRIIIFGIMTVDDPNFIEFNLQIPNFISSQDISFHKNQKNPKKWIVLGTLFLCQRGHRNFIFGIMKELDSNFIDIKLQIPNFIGSKVISFQSETIFSKISKSKILTPHKIFLGYPWTPKF